MFHVAPRAQQRLTVAAALVSLVSLLDVTAARATVLPVQGGPGGGSFSAECPADQFLVGVSIRAGAWLDAMMPLCASFDGHREKFGEWTRGTRVGGQGGSALLRDGDCPKDRFVSGIMFGHTRKGYDPLYVDFVQLTCSPIAGSAKKTKICLETGNGCYVRRRADPVTAFGGVTLYHNTMESIVQSCPKGEAVTGLHGRAGAYVDALGLICGPKPAAAPNLSRKETYEKLKEARQSQIESGKRKRIERIIQERRQ